MNLPINRGTARRLGIRPPDLGVYGHDWAYGRDRGIVLFPRAGRDQPAGWARLRVGKRTVP